MAGPRTLADLGEFGLIDRIERASQRAAIPGVGGPVLGIGDDAALLRVRSGEDVAVSTDAAVENVHFRFDTASARSIGCRALAAALSDLAAMGARPLGVVAALSAPGTLPVRIVDGLIGGLLSSSREHAAPLVGGNVTRGPHVALTLTVVGAVRRGAALRRDAARAGDRLFVTGTLGRSALALARAEAGGAPIRHVPTPRLEAGRRLSRVRGRGACIDVSDGLLADLGHLTRASGVAAEIDPARLPGPRGMRAACRHLGLDPEDVLLRGGEDYELLFSVRPDGPPPAALARRLGVTVTEIGRLRAGRGVRGVAVGGRGPAGYLHF